MVLTHLIQLRFYRGATPHESAVPATFGGFTAFPPFYAFKGFSVGAVAPEPEPPSAPISIEPLLGKAVRLEVARKRKRKIRKLLLLGW